MEVLFYGLFMDEAILQKYGLRPRNPRKAVLQDYVLKIGDRASLLPSKNESAYGILMTVDDEAIHDLYAEASVADYIPERVTVITDSNAAVSAICYNLPAEKLSGSNATYAASLHKLAQQLDFPEDYLQKIAEYF